jgi:hypothetical protein
VWRYVAVSATAAGLNAGGVALLAMLGMPFVVSWCIARGVVFATWSYPLQRDFVFATDASAHSEPAVATRP